MATKGSRYWTFRDLLSGRTPDGLVDRNIVEMMAQENPVLQDVLWKECNKGREDFTTIRSGMPEAVVRAFYEGWVGSKSSKMQVANACCTVTTGIEFDWRLYQATKDKEAFLSDEQRAHFSIAGDKAASLLFYGDTGSDPKGINGFAKTFSEYGPISGSNMMMDDKKAAFYCLNGGKASEAGSSASSIARRSIFLVGWGQRSCHGLYPEGGKAGIDVGQLESTTQKQADGTNLKLGLQEINQDLGLNIRDFRYCGRIANINVMTDPLANDAPEVARFVRRLVTRVKTTGVTHRFYTSRLVFEYIADQFAKQTSSNAVKYADLEQKKEASLLGIPVAFCDCMNGDETEVPAVA